MAKFILLQSSVVFNQQMTLFDEKYEDTKEGRNSAFRSTIRKLIEKKIVRLNPRITEYILLYKHSFNDDIIYFQLAKKIQMGTFSLNNNEIEQKQIDSYPPLDVFVNLKTQQFAVEINSSLLSVQSIESIIKNLLNSVTKQFTIFVNSMQDKKEFWGLINNDEEIQEISFDLIVPNLFGATEEAKNLVEKAKQDLNADNVLLSFKNKKGQLKATIESIDSFVKYSSSTGSWKLKIKQNGATKYIIVKSADFCKKKEIEDNILEAIKSLNSNGQIEMDIMDNLTNKLYGIFENEIEE